MNPKIEPYKHLLGRQLDVKLAVLADVAPKTVSRARRALGRARAPRSVRGHYATILGTIPDRAVAKRAGKANSTIADWRKHYGIQSYRARNTDRTLGPRGMLRGSLEYRVARYITEAGPVSAAELRAKFGEAGVKNLWRLVADGMIDRIAPALYDRHEAPSAER